MTVTDNRSYYDAFSAAYDRDRSAGYHKLIDDQAAELVRRVGDGKDVLEVGCGTGLVLERVARFAKTARGIDLSPGMLEKAKARGLDVREGDCTKLPFDDATFDVAYSFKVLAHVPDVDQALREMARVVKVGGTVVFDVYNRNSARWLIKRLFGPRKTSNSFDEKAIETRFWTPAEAESHLPAGTRLIGSAGIRIATVHPAVLKIPGIGKLTESLEWKLMDSPLHRLGGFLVLFAERCE